MLARKPQSIGNGDVERRRKNGTKGNKALFTALPKVHPCKRPGIIYKLPAPWGCNGNKGSHINEKNISPQQRVQNPNYILLSP